MRRLIVLIASLIAVPAFAASYAYTGPLFSMLNNSGICTEGKCGKYTRSMRVTGTFSTASPLAANLYNADISALIASYRFNDGINTIASIDLGLNAIALVAKVSTDSTGTISGWLFLVSEWTTGTNGVHTGGDRFNYISSYGGNIAVANGNPGDYGENNLGCLSLASETCTEFQSDAGTSEAVTNLEGSWVLQTVAPNYQGLWWASPAASESGWGINFAHQGDTIFASWFTYDLTGKGMWLVMTAPKTAPGVYSGALYTTTGPAFNAVPFNPMQVVATQVGTGTLSFTDANDGTFAYIVNGIAQMKSITREIFGTLPSCATATGSLAAATNYTDLWWASPANSESGWGINLTQEGTTIFGTWFTYDLNGMPMWLVVTAPNTAPGVYSGTLYRTTGPAFNAVPFNPSNVVATSVGTASFTFSDGNNATFAYTVNGVSQTKAITREVFASPGTACN